MRVERLTRDLRAALSETKELHVDVDLSHAEAADGDKGAALADLALLITGGSPMVITALRTWCARDKNRKVELVRTGTKTSVTITGSPNAAQQQLIETFLGQADADEDA